MRRHRLLLVLVLTLSGRAAWPQGGSPLGPEFRVNSYTTDDQFGPAVASDTSGNFVIVWTSRNQGPLYDVFGQRYSASGAPLGLEFRVNTYTPNVQGVEAVGSDPAGNFVVAWTSYQDGSSYGTFGQRFASSGAPLGPEFRVNTYTPYAQGFPSVSVDSTGNFVVVWESGYQDGSAYGAFGQRFASSGAPLGPEFRVNTYTTGAQYDPKVARDSTGNFIVVWSSVQDGSAEGVFGQRYASTGAPLGVEFRVNTYTTSGQFFPGVACDSAGNFVIVWMSQFQDGSSDGIFGQRFGSTGAPLGSEFRVNTYTTLNQFRPAVTADPSGNFVVTWDSVLQDGSTDGIFGQRFASTGAPLGPEFRVNTYTTNVQSSVAVAASAGNFVVSWMGDTQDGNGYGVFAQRFGPILPVELMSIRVE